MFMNSITLSPDDAMTIDKVRRCEDGMVTHVLVSYGIDGRNKYGHLTHGFKDVDVKLTRDEFIRLAKNCKAIYIRFRESSYEDENKYQSLECAKAYLVHIENVIYIRRDQNLTPYDDFSHTVLMND